MKELTFANPDLLYLLFLLVPMGVWFFLRDRDAHAGLTFPTLKPFAGREHSLRYYLRYLLLLLRLALIALIILILARPQSVNRWQNTTTEGIDIVIALDISSSMLAQDLKPDRLDASKDVAIQFISGRPYDRMGLVVYSGESFTQCPLTTDHAVLINLFRDIKSGMIKDGTGIRNGTGDGSGPTQGQQGQEQGGHPAHRRGEQQRVHCPGHGRRYRQNFRHQGLYHRGRNQRHGAGPRADPLRDEDAERPGGDRRRRADPHRRHNGRKNTFRTTDNQKLQAIYKEIDQMEKSKIDVKQFSKKQEEFGKFGLAALVVLLAEIAGRYLILWPRP